MTNKILTILVIWLLASCSSYIKVNVSSTYENDKIIFNGKYYQSPKTLKIKYVDSTQCNTTLRIAAMNPKNEFIRHEQITTCKDTSIFIR